MSDEDKRDAVCTLMDLYGGWLALSHAMLGDEVAGNPAWVRYHARIRELEATMPHEQKANRWDMTWTCSFWDTIQELEL